MAYTYIYQISYIPRKPILPWSYFCFWNAGKIQRIHVVFPVHIVHNLSMNLFVFSNILQVLKLCIVI
jgi:hypothetical protein